MKTIHAHRTTGHGMLARTTARAAACALLVLAAVQPTPASAAELPNGADVLDAYVEATGGVAAHKKIRSRITNGTMSVAGMGIEGAVTISAAGGDLYLVWDATGVGKVENGVHDGVAWEINPMSGARVKEGAERRAALRTAALDHTVNWGKYYKSVECVGLETLDDRACYKVVVTLDGEAPKTQYFDRDTALLVRVEGEVESEHGAMNMRIDLDDYREVDGIRLPHKSTYNYNDMQTIVLEAKTIQHNVDVPRERFALPDEIESRLETRRSEKAG